MPKFSRITASELCADNLLLTFYVQHVDTCLALISVVQTALIPEKRVLQRTCLDVANEVTPAPYLFGGNPSLEHSCTFCGCCGIYDPIHLLRLILLLQVRILEERKAHSRSVVISLEFPIGRFGRAAWGRGNTWSVGIWVESSWVQLVTLELGAGASPQNWRARLLKISSTCNRFTC